MNDNYNPNQNAPDEQNRQDNGAYDAHAGQSQSGHVWNVPPQEDSGDYRPPYYSGAGGQPPRESLPPQQYSASDGWQSRDMRGKTPYQWNFSEYEQAAGAAKPKRHRGLMVFGVILGSVLAVSLVCFAGIGIYSTLSRASAPPAPAADGPALQVPADNLPGITIQNKPETVEETLPGGKLTSEQIIEKVSPSVVAITTYVNYQNYQAEGMGSGIIIREDGYIVTNAHVIEKAKGITVQLSDGTSYEGRVVGSDTRTDLAVVKIDATGLTAAVLGNSDQVKMGEKVLAIGNPQSMAFVGSATQGIVSGLNREVTAGGQNGTTVTHYADLIQTDAAINPGNSGGALVNEYGQVIGINSAKVAATGAEGMGFAIPSNQVKEIVDDLIAHGRVTGRVRLGIYAVEVDAVLARLNHVPTGLLVQSTEVGSDISSKGVVPGDIITKVDGTEIAGTNDLSKVIKDKKPGDTVELEVYRPSQRPNSEGRFFNITVALMEDMGDTAAPQTQQVPQQEQQPSEDQYYSDMGDFFDRFFG